MKPRFRTRLCTLSYAILGIALMAGVAVRAYGQGPGGAPHGGGPPGGPGGPPGMGGPGMGGPGGMPGNGGPPPGTNANAVAGKRASDGAPRMSQQFGPVGRWWDDKSVIRSVGISKAQQKKMDAVFDANKPAILESYKAFLSAQSALDKVNRDPTSDQATIFAAIDAVSSARASLQKSTAQMLLQIRQQMDADQITKLEKLQ